MTNDSELSLYDEDTISQEEIDTHRRKSNGQLQKRARKAKRDSGEDKEWLSFLADSPKRLSKEYNDGYDNALAYEALACEEWNLFKQLISLPLPKLKAEKSIHQERIEESGQVTDSGQSAMAVINIIDLAIAEIEHFQKLPKKSQATINDSLKEYGQPTFHTQSGRNNSGFRFRGTNENTAKRLHSGLVAANLIPEDVTHDEFVKAIFEGNTTLEWLDDWVVLSIFAARLDENKVLQSSDYWAITQNLFRKETKACSHLRKHYDRASDCTLNKWTDYFDSIIDHAFVAIF